MSSEDSATTTTTTAAAAAAATPTAEPKRKGRPPSKQLAPPPPLAPSTSSNVKIVSPNPKKRNNNNNNNQEDSSNSLLIPSSTTTTNAPAAAAATPAAGLDFRLFLPTPMTATTPWDDALLGAVAVRDYAASTAKQQAKKMVALSKQVRKAHQAEQKQQELQDEARNATLTRIGRVMSRAVDKTWTRAKRGYEARCALEIDIEKQHKAEKRQESFLKDTQKLTAFLAESFRSLSSASAPSSSSSATSTTAAAASATSAASGIGTLEFEHNLSLLNTLDGQRPLRPYQRSALAFLINLYNNNLNAILGDEMGLGKTVQTLALLAYFAEYKQDWGPHLIVVPASIVANWELECLRWVPGLKVIKYQGSAKERAKLRTGWSRENAFHICLVSYATVVADRNIFKRRSWGFLVLDEAHNIKNWQSQKWQVLFEMQSAYRLLLTGTPLQTSVMELWALLRFIVPPHVAIQAAQKHLQMQKEKKKLVKQQQEEEQQQQQQQQKEQEEEREEGDDEGDREGEEQEGGLAAAFENMEDFQRWFSDPLTAMVSGQSEFDSDVILRLHALLRPFFFRRLKCDVEAQLPPKKEVVVLCPLSRRQKQLYEDFLSLAETKETLACGSYLGVVRVLLALRKVCNHPDLFAERPVLSPLCLDPQVDRLIMKVPRCIFLHHVDEKMRGFPSSSSSSSSSRSGGVAGGGKPYYLLSKLNTSRSRHLVDSSYSLNFTSSAFLLSQSCSKLQLLSSSSSCSSTVAFWVDDLNPNKPREKDFLFKEISTNKNNNNNNNNNNEDEDEDDDHNKKKQKKSKNQNQNQNNKKSIKKTTATTKSKSSSNNNNDDDAAMKTVLSIRKKKENNDIELSNSVQQFMLKSASSKVDDAIQFFNLLFPLNNSNNQTSHRDPQQQQNQNQNQQQQQQQQQKNDDNNVVLQQGTSFSSNREDVVNYFLNNNNSRNNNNNSKKKTGNDVPTTSLHQRERAQKVVEMNSERNQLFENIQSFCFPVDLCFINVQARILGNSSPSDITSRSPVFKYFVPTSHQRVESCRETLQHFVVFVPRAWTRSPMLSCALPVCYDGSSSSSPSCAFYDPRLSSFSISSSSAPLELVDPYDLAQQAVTSIRNENIHRNFNSPSLSTRTRRGRGRISVGEATKKFGFETGWVFSRHFHFPESRWVVQDCGKFFVLYPLFKRLAAEGHRVLIFTQFTGMLSILEKFLAFMGFAYLRLDGSIPPDERQFRVEQFNRDSRIFAMVLSTRSGGIGLNLIGADTVVFFDSDWNPAMDLQAQDRCHRIGQTRAVTIYRLVSEHTVEASIVKKARQRKMLNNIVIRSGQFHRQVGEFAAASSSSNSAEEGGGEAGGLDAAAAALANANKMNREALLNFFHDRDEDADVFSATSATSASIISGERKQQGQNQDEDEDEEGENSTTATTGGGGGGDWLRATAAVEDAEDRAAAGTAAEEEKQQEATDQSAWNDLFQDIDQEQQQSSKNNNNQSGNQQQHKVRKFIKGPSSAFPTSSSSSSSSSAGWPPQMNNDIGINQRLLTTIRNSTNTSIESWAACALPFFHKNTAAELREKVANSTVKRQNRDLM